MIIRCDRCDTEFSLDDAQMREGGTAVRCSVCSHVFTAHPPDPRDVGHRPWQIRTDEGVLFSAKNLRVVANWIQEGRLAPNDQISRTGHRWRLLSEIPEFRGLLGLGSQDGVLKVVEQPLTPSPLTAPAPKTLGKLPQNKIPVAKAPLGSPALSRPAKPQPAASPRVPEHTLVDPHPLGAHPDRAAKLQAPAAKLEAPADKLPAASLQAPADKLSAPAATLQTPSHSAGLPGEGAGKSLKDAFEEASLDEVSLDGALLEEPEPPKDKGRLGASLGLASGVAAGLSARLSAGLGLGSKSPSEPAAEPEAQATLSASAADVVPTEEESELALENLQRPTPPPLPRVTETTSTLNPPPPRMSASLQKAKDQASARSSRRAGSFQSPFGPSAIEQAASSSSSDLGLSPAGLGGRTLTSHPQIEELSEDIEEIEELEELTPDREDGPQEGHTRTGVSVDDMRSRIREREENPALLAAAASKRRAMRIAGGASLVAAVGLLAVIFISGGSESGDAPKSAAIIQGDAQEEVGGVRASRAALQAMDPAALRSMEAKLHAQMQREDLSKRSRSKAKFLLIQLLTERALQLSLAATLSENDAQMLLDAARSDVMRARGLFNADRFSDIAPERVQIAQLRLEFAEGRPLKDLPRLLPAAGALDSRALLQAAALWRDAHDPVDPALLVKLSEDVKALSAAQTPSTLLEEALAVAQFRSGHTAAAHSWATARLANAIGDPVAGVIEDAIVLSDAKAQATGGAVGSGAALGDSTASGALAKADLGVEQADSADALLNRGCKLVERGSASAGIEVLQKALEKEPDDLDVLLCLAQGYARSGDQERSLVFFEQILQRSPRHRSALYGAATAAAARGEHERATKHYKTLIEVEPGHGPAAAYLEVHGGS